ncbi:MAG: gene transfer agent family protein [Acidobacteria bacterium]|nr:gene transfer agent family protein [Acidobacteriota bacterium]
MKPHNPLLPVQVGGQRHVLALRLGELQRLEAETDTPLERLFWTVSGGDGKIPQLQAILRLGLTGGGMTEAEAEATVSGWLEGESLVELRVVASGVMSHALRRASPDEVDFDALGKVTGEDGQSGGHSPAASSTGPNTSETAPPSGGRRRRSKPSPSGSTTAP